MPSVTRSAVRVAADVDDLLAGATGRVAAKGADSLSGSRFERLLIGGRPHLVKYMSLDDDWIMRAAGDLCCRQRAFWASSLVDAIPPEIDHTVVGMAGYRSATGREGLALLMRDVSPHLVPEGGSLLPDEVHLRFLDHMSALHAALWGWRDDLGLAPMSTHYTILTPTMSALEAARGGDDPVPRLVGPGWARFREVAPGAAEVVLPLLLDCGPLVTALQRTPMTFIHGDWKLGNLGSHPDGRTILVDWDRCGEGPPCFELAWYLAVNCDRIGFPKEAAIDAYRRSLAGRGIRTEPWFEEQLALCLLGALLMLGWAKTGGDPAELAWWEERATAAERYLR